MTTYDLSGFSEENAYKLLGVLQSFAPNGAAQELCAKIYRDAWSQGNEIVVRTMLECLTNGVQHDLWPWMQEGG